MKYGWLMVSGIVLAGLVMIVSWNVGSKKMAASWFEPSEAALEAAVNADDAQAVQRALQGGANVNALGKHRITPLMVAVDRLKQSAALALLQAGANPNLKADDGASAVSLAVANYRQAPELMVAIFRAGGDPNARTPGNDPVIKRFVNDRDCKQMAAMKAWGADLNAVTRNDRPLVLSAAMTSDWDSVWCLLELGAKFDYPVGPPQHNLVQMLADPFPAPDSPIYPFKVKVRDFLRSKGLNAPDLAGDKK